MVDRRYAASTVSHFRVAAKSSSTAVRSIGAEIMGQRPVARSRRSHSGAFRALTATARAVVRTGECSPYANVILVSKVTF
ncbi:MAG: RbsD/FucU domain-containing protein [Thermomicrobiales bacterium]